LPDLLRYEKQPFANLLVAVRIIVGMIVGNPNAGKRTATAAVALVLMLILITAIVALRKKTAPAKEPPLHPSVATFAIF
jgi:hypothetical protein